MTETSPSPSGVFPTPDECLTRARLAQAFSAEHLQAATTLAGVNLYPQAFGMLLYSVEEATKGWVYLWAYADLVTFDPSLAGTKRFFAESWLYDHPRKHAEFGRTAGTQLLDGFFPLALSQMSSNVSLGTVLVVVGIAGFVGLGKWVGDFEDLRETSFHSGPPRSGRTDVGRPTQSDCARLEPIVRGEVERLRERLDLPIDRMELERELPDLDEWKQLTSQSPKQRRAALDKVLAELDKQS
jgi:hypothetical protein